MGLLWVSVWGTGKFSSEGGMTGWNVKTVGVNLGGVRACGAEITLVGE